MHVPTHILSGWCVANLLPLKPRKRLCCMIAASAADVDGMGILFGEKWYFAFHHIVGHNLFFAIAISIVLASFSRPARTFWVYLLLAHLHLLMDYFGSGPLWSIYYLWPVSHWHIRFDGAWAFYSWQNIAAAGLLLLGTLAIARYRGRTPLEVLMPSLDQQLVTLIRPRACETEPIATAQIER